MKFAKFVVKMKVPILILTLILMIPSAFLFLNTKINYDMLTYLPEDMETVKGQNILLDEFGKGGFSLITIEGMSDEEVSNLRKEIENVDHVATALWYDKLTSLSLPKELIPDKIYNAFNNDEKDATMIAVFFDGSTSDEDTLNAIREIRKLCNDKCFVSGLSALVVDLKDLCEKEEPIYVAIAVLLSLAVMFVFLDNWLIPIIFIVSIASMILLNLGTNFFLGEISYITKALSAVLQLAVTMDYSIFLWHSYNEEQSFYNTKEEAMASAIHKTFVSILGSSITTIAGFIALCFMTFSLGADLGIVMAKGVVFGIIGSVTVLPSLILVFDKILTKTSHKAIIPDMGKFAKGVIKIFPVFLIIFLLILPPAYIGYTNTNKEVYYNLIETLPEDMDCVIANSKLKEDFEVGSTHLLLIDSSTSQKDVKKILDEVNEVDGIKYAIGIESLIGSSIPKDVLPDSVRELLENDKYELALANSTYTVATDECNNQIDEINDILHKYDPTGMLIGEGPCMKDMIETTDTDFRNVNIISIIAIFIIILLVERSITLPVILIAVIETAIFINLGLSHYIGQSLPFIAPICISTIQLGATVDYAILMTTRYKSERISGNDAKKSVIIALKTSIPSIIVSGLGLFAATFGVSLYSDVDMITSICSLMARGAIISILMVIFILPALLRLFDKLICHTTLGMRHCVKRSKNNE